MQFLARAEGVFEGVFLERGGGVLCEQDNSAETFGGKRQRFNGIRINTTHDIKRRQAANTTD